MNIEELVAELHCTQRLMKRIRWRGAYAGVLTAGGEVSKTEADLLRFMFSILRDRQVLRTTLGRFSPVERRKLVAQSGLTDRMDAWLYTRMSTLLSDGERVDLQAVASQAAYVFKTDVDECLISKARRVRQKVYNSRKTKNRGDVGNNGNGQTEGRVMEG